MSYKLDTDAARQADSFGNRINETGQYIGVFVSAEEVVSQQGTLGIEFTFKAGDGRTANFLTVWTTKSNGEKLRGFKTVNALMTCLRLREITPRQGMIMKYDPVAKKDVQTQANVFPDLANKPIGVLLQKEEYMKNNGNIGEKLNLVGVFDAATKLMASEILDKKTVPEALEKIVAQLKDRPFQQKSQASNNTPPLADFDDDISF